METLKTRYNRIVSTAWKSALKPAGFKRKGNRFARRTDLIHLIEFSKSQWSSKESARFSIHLGVYPPGIANWTGYQEEEKEFPSLGRCSFDIGLHDIPGEPIPRTFKLNVETADPERMDCDLVGGLVRKLRLDCIPFLDRFQTLQDLIGYMEGWPNLIPEPAHPHPAEPWDHKFVMSVLYSLAGDEEKSLSTLRSAYEVAEAEGVSFFAESLKEVYDYREQINAKRK